MAEAGDQGADATPPPKGRDEVERARGEVVPDDQGRPPGTHRHVSFSGSLQSSEYVSQLPATAEDAGAWAELVSDAPERLLAATEREQAHRHEIENRAIALDEGAMPRYYAGQRRAHYISLTLGIAYLAVMVVIAVLGQPVAGMIGAAAGIAAMVWAIRRDPSSSDLPPPAEPQPDQLPTSPPNLPPPDTEPELGPHEQR